jgi:hypothetical protein
MKAGIVEQEEKAIARQRCGKHVSAIINANPMSSHT